MKGSISLDGATVNEDPVGAQFSITNKSYELKLRADNEDIRLSWIMSIQRQIQWLVARKQRLGITADSIGNELSELTRWNDGNRDIVNDGNAANTRVIYKGILMKKPTQNNTIGSRISISGWKQRYFSLTIFELQVIK